jgi:DNA-binding transcriptional LysR family regulator
LIERGTHTLRLTEEGRALHARTEGVLAEITEAGEAVRSGAATPRGRLRVSAPVVLAHVALSAIGARFARAYPQVQLEIVAEDRMVDPVEDGYDLVIRINPGPDERLIGRRILNDERLLVASPAVPFPSFSETAEEIPVQAVVLTSTPPGMTWSIRTETSGVRLFSPVPLLRLSSLLMVREAAMAGAGAALLPKLLVDADLDAGRLVHWGTENGSPVEIWALQNSRRLVSAKVRAFLDALDAAFPNRLFDANA